MLDSPSRMIEPHPALPRGWTSQQPSVNNITGRETMRGGTLLRASTSSCVKENGCKGRTSGSHPFAAAIAPRRLSGFHVGDTCTTLSTRSAVMATSKREFRQRVEVERNSSDLKTCRQNFSLVTTLSLSNGLIATSPIAAMTPGRMQGCSSK